MKRSVLVLVLALILLPCLMGFAAGKFRIAVSLPPANNAWQAKMLDTVLAEVAKDKDKFDIVVKNAVDDADQLNMLQTFKEGGYDMICVLPGQRHPDDPDLPGHLQGRHQGHDHRQADRGRPVHRVLRRRQRAVRQERGKVHRRQAEGQGPDRDPAQLRRHPHRPAALQRVHGSAQEELPRHQGPRRGRRRVQPGSGPQGHVQHPPRVPQDRRGLHPGRRGRCRRAHRDPQRPAARTSSSSPAWAAPRPPSP